MKGTETKYLKWYQKVAYGAGDLASNTSYGLVSSFVLLYLSDTMGLSTGIIGTLMLLSKVLDGISDVIFGTMIDRTKIKIGKSQTMDAICSVRSFVMLDFAVLDSGRIK